MQSKLPPYLLNVLKSLSNKDLDLVYWTVNLEIDKRFYDLHSEDFSLSNEFDEDPYLSDIKHKSNQENSNE